MRKIITFIACLLITASAGLIGRLATTSQIPHWYADLHKPSFNPPNWVFGPAWGILYIMMATALYLVIVKPVSISKFGAYSVFFIQLILNSAWSVIFFGLHHVFVAFLVIMVLWFFILLCILVFSRISKTAAYLMIPYIAWVTFAAFLNFYIWQLN